jgi:hypothetical protein
LSNNAALFVYPENESLGIYSQHGVPWMINNNYSTSKEAVFVIALNRTSLPHVLYVHFNNIPVARHAIHASQQQLLIGQQLPLECWTEHGAFAQRFFDDSFAASLHLLVSIFLLFLLLNSNRS